MVPLTGPLYEQCTNQRAARSPWTVEAGASQEDSETQVVIERPCVLGIDHLKSN